MENKKKKILLTLLSLGVYLLSTGLSYVAFASSGINGTIFTSPLPSGKNQGTKEDVNNDRKALFDISGPQSESCPINGAKYTKAEKAIWETRRP